MAATLVLDAVQDATAETDRGGFAATRTGIIRGIDTSASPSEILASALAVAGMPAYLSNFPSTDPVKAKAQLVRHLVKPFPRQKNKAFVWLRYETIDAGGGVPGGAFVLERRTTIVTEEANMIFSDGTTFDIFWKNTKDVNNEQLRDTATLPIYTPMQSLTATGYYVGTPPSVLTTGICSVNSSDWHDFPKGYWMYVGEDDRTEDWGGHYTIQLQFLTRVRRDWSSWAFFRDPSTGRILPASGADKANVMAQPYKKGLYTTTTGGLGSGGRTNLPNGFVRVGQYELLNFSTSFGF